MDAQNSDALSMSSVLLDILLQEDACSGTGSASSGSGVSAAAESLGSGSNGCGMSGSRTGNTGSKCSLSISEEWEWEGLQTPLEHQVLYEKIFIVFNTHHIVYSLFLFYYIT